MYSCASGSSLVLHPTWLRRMSDLGMSLTGSLLFCQLERTIAGIETVQWEWQYLVTCMPASPMRQLSIFHCTEAPAACTRFRSSSLSAVWSLVSALALPAVHNTARQSPAHSNTLSIVNPLCTNTSVVHATVT